MDRLVRAKPTRLAKPHHCIYVVVFFDVISPDKMTSMVKAASVSIEPPGISNIGYCSRKFADDTQDKRKAANHGLKPHHCKYTIMTYMGIGHIDLLVLIPGDLLTCSMDIFKEIPSL